MAEVSHTSISVWHSQIAPGIVSLVSRRPRKLFAVWIGVYMLCGSLAPLLFKATSFDIHPAIGSDSEQARNMMGIYFPETATSLVAIFYVEGSMNLVNETSALRRITENLQVHFEDPATRKVGYTCKVVGYYTLVAENKSVIASGLVSPSRRASIITVIHQPADDVDAQAMGFDLLSFGEHLRSEFSPEVFVGVSGAPVVIAESSAKSLDDLSRSDSVVIPLSMIVLSLMVSSWRLLVVTFVNFTTAVFVTFAVTWLLTVFGMQLSTAVPALMASLLLALSVDYSLFLLTRFVEELQADSPVAVAAEESLKHAGHTILGSGSTLMICFLALCAFPFDLMQTFGIGVSIAIFVAILVNVLLTPVLLLSFPDFFSVLGWCCCPCPVRRDLPSSEEGPLESRTAKFAKCTTQRMTSVIVVVLVSCVLLGMGPAAAKIKTSGDIFQSVPRGSLSQITMEKFMASFSTGFANPYDVLLVPSVAVANPQEKGAIFKGQFWADTVSIMKVLESRLPKAGSSAILSPMFVSGNAIPANFSLNAVPVDFQVELWRMCHETFDQVVSPKIQKYINPTPCKAGDDCCFKTVGSDVVRLAIQAQTGKPVTDRDVHELVGTLRGILQQTTNLEGSAVRAQMMVDLSLGSDAGCEFVRQARRDLSRTWNGTQVWLANGDTVITDVVDIVQSYTTPICGAISIVVLLVVGLLYWSCAIPLRGVVTIALTEVVGFAILKLIYCDGALASLQIDAVAKSGSLFFLIPPMVFSVVLGLSLDYDVFLVGRIIEARSKGMSDEVAIQHGVCKTSKIITAAGTIMAIAFSGLLFSSTTMMNTFGVVMVSAVLLDTFIVRALVTPALMAPLGRVNWLPRKMPEPVVGAECATLPLNSSSVSLQSPA